ERKNVRVVLEWLRAAFIETDDREPRMRHLNPAVGPETNLIGTTFPQASKRTMTERPVYAVSDEYSAHGLLPCMKSWDLLPKARAAPSLKRTGSRPMSFRRFAGSPRQ